MENNFKVLKKLNMQLPYDPAITFLDICPREMKTYAHTKACSGMCIAASCMIAENWKQLKCPSMSEWLNKLLYTMECYLGPKRNKLSIHTTSTDLKGITLNENNPISRGYILYDSIYITFLK